MLRYHFLVAAKCLGKYEYLYLIDVDARFVRKIGSEIIGNRVALLGHHHTKFAPYQYPYCRDKQSAAFVPFEQGQFYYVGGFQGGQTSTYLQDCRVIAAAISQDLRGGRFAQWHDESYWNRHLVDHLPTNSLPWEYATSEAETTGEERIVFVVKDHEAYRAWQ